MPILPVVTREMAVQARRKSTYWIRVLASLIGGFLMLWLLVVTAASTPVINQGRALFSVLSGLGFVYCLLVGALVTADCLSVEKREGTIGLLFLTDLKGYDVVLGKLASSSLHAIYGLLATVPMMSLALLFGGVLAAEVARMVLVLGNTLFLSLSAGIFVSTLSKNERKAAFGSLLVVLLVAGGPFPLSYYLAEQGLLGDSSEFGRNVILSVSPIYAFRLLSPSVGAGAWFPSFYQSLLNTHLIGWILLASACLMAPRVCRDRPAGQWRLDWIEAWRRFTRGSRESRMALRRRLLDRNACLWLCSQHRNGSVWVLILPMAGLAPNANRWLAVR